MGKEIGQKRKEFSLGIRIEEKYRTCPNSDCRRICRLVQVTYVRHRALRYILIAE